MKNKSAKPIVTLALSASLLVAGASAQAATVFYRTAGGNLHSFASLADMGNEANALSTISWDGSENDATVYDGSMFYRSWGDHLEGYGTVEDMAARTNIVSDNWWTGSPKDSLGFDGTNYFRSFGENVEFYTTVADLGARTNMTYSLLRDGDHADAFECVDAVTCYRAYDSTLEVYGSAADMAQRTNLVSSSYWMGSETNTTFAVSEVPVPAAAWLFGSALMGLGGAARRKKASS